eukprot:1145349-Pelagomonas_calceolata.AAC.3
MLVYTYTLSRIPYERRTFGRVSLDGALAKQLPPPYSLQSATFVHLQIASILQCFSMGDEAVRAAALLFTRAADLEENLDALTSALQFKTNSNVNMSSEALMENNFSLERALVAVGGVASR